MNMVLKDNDGQYLPENCLLTLGSSKISAISKQTEQTTKEKKQPPKLKLLKA